MFQFLENGFNLYLKLSEHDNEHDNKLKTSQKLWGI